MVRIDILLCPTEPLCSSVLIPSTAGVVFSLPGITTQCDIVFHFSLALTPSFQIHHHSCNEDIERSATLKQLRGRFGRGNIAVMTHEFVPFYE